MERQNGVGIIIFAGEQGGQLGVLHGGHEGGKAFLHLGHQTLILGLVAKLAQGHQIIPLSLALLLAFDFVAQLLDPLLYLLGLLQVVPKAVGGALRFQHLRLPLGGLQPQGLVQILQFGAQVVQLYFVFVKLQHHIHSHFHKIALILYPKKPVM